MNDAVFFSYFLFNEFCINETRHRDNSKRVGCHYLGFMKQGKGLIISGNKRLEIAENEMFYIPKGCKYHSYWIANNIVKFDSIGFLYFPSNAKNGYSLQKINYDEKIFEEFLPLSNSKAINVNSVGQLYRLLGSIEEIMEKAPFSRSDEVVNNLILLMNKNHQRTIAEYAVDCDVSETLLYKYVQKVLKKTPNRLRQEIACQKAIKLLCSTSLSVEEICGRIGFSSASYFRKVLFSVVGKTPSDVRKEANLI